MSAEGDVGVAGLVTGVEAMLDVCMYNDRRGVVNSGKGTDDGDDAKGRPVSVNAGVLAGG